MAATKRPHKLTLRIDFQGRVILYVAAYVRKIYVRKYIEAVHERSLVRVRVEPSSTSLLSSALFVLPLPYLRGARTEGLKLTRVNVREF